MANGIPQTRRSWLERLTAKPERPRGYYFGQAFLIGLALLVAIGALLVFAETKGSILWLIGADLLVVLACGRTAAWIVGIVSMAIGAAEGILAIMLLGAMLFAIPILAPIFFVWNFIQAVRARETGPGEDDGWL